MLIAHREAGLDLALGDNAYKIIRPQSLEFISYPYEWCPSQLKDAALTTLEIQEQALAKGLWLKDASAFNIQFRRGRPLLIDTLSFAQRPPGEPWPAYRQFCQHFLAPLALMTLVDVRLGRLVRLDVDGVPLDLASRLLPRRSWLNFGLAVHLHLHARAQRRYADTAVEQRRAGRSMSDQGVLGLVQSLRGAVQRLKWQKQATPWGDYEQQHGYAGPDHEAKRRIVSDFLVASAPAQVWDLGANIGSFSRLASDRGIPTVAFDLDPDAVEANYRQVRERRESNLLPLLMDLANPSPSIGWSNAERDSLLARAPVEAVMALALVHHLCIGNNVPLAGLAEFMARLGKWLIVEWVPKQDPQVQRLLRNREDVFPDYDQAHFEAEFGRHFDLRQQQPIGGSGRVLYLMANRAPWTG